MPHSALARGNRPMPEMHFLIRWPDGSAERCYSPSRIVREFLSPGESYALADFLQRSRAALNVASDRVEERHGHACSRAAAQLMRIETVARAFADLPAARVTVDAFET
jgi:uncharacterized repeat protein (TIGR04042 family)